MPYPPCYEAESQVSHTECDGGATQSFGKGRWMEAGPAFEHDGQLNTAPQQAGTRPHAGLGGFCKKRVCWRGTATPGTILERAQWW